MAPAHPAGAPGAIPQPETIAAVATPPGEGGIGILRVSGPRVREIAAGCFRASRANDPAWTGLQPYRLHRGSLLDARGAPVDEILAVLMPGPGSYTGEDVLELHCHGSPVVLAAALETCLALGARPAEPGEFTKRAYLAGKLDLTQAEAVAALIHAPSRGALAAARAQLSGLLGRRVRELRRELAELRAHLCLAVDFPEDDLEIMGGADLDHRVGSLVATLDELLAAGERGRGACSAPAVVLAGPVNAGKSSLLNALLGRERAIVSATPGTTRDWIEAEARLGAGFGVRVRLVDTAGLRGLEAFAPDTGETPEVIEAEGIRRSRELLAQASVVLLCLDGSQPWPESELAAQVASLALPTAGPRLLAVLTKSDLAADLAPGEPSAGVGLEVLGIEHLAVSALRGDGLEVLSRRVGELLEQGAAGTARCDELAPNLRQSQELAEAAAELRGLRDDLAAGVPCDLLGVRLEAASRALARITGEISSAEVLDAVFADFCIGK